MANGPFVHGVLLDLWPECSLPATLLDILADSEEFDSESVDVCTWEALNMWNTAGIISKVIVLVLIDRGKKEITKQAFTAWN